MNENSTMLYRYPPERKLGELLPVRIWVDGALVFKDFNTKIVPTEEVEKWEDWYKTPVDAFDPPKKKEKSEVPVATFDSPVTIGTTQLDKIEISMEQAIDEINAIKGQGSKGKLVKYLADFGVSLNEEANFPAMKKKGIELLKAKYDMD